MLSWLLLSCHACLSPSGCRLRVVPLLQLLPDAVGVLQAWVEGQEVRNQSQQPVQSLLLLLIQRSMRMTPITKVDIDTNSDDYFV